MTAVTLHDGNTLCDLAPLLHHDEAESAVIVSCRMDFQKTSIFQCAFCSKMPRNASRKQQKLKHQEEHPEVTHQLLPLAKKLACFNFSAFLETQGEEGWDPEDKPGTVCHWRSSELVRKSMKQSSWRNIGAVRSVHECLAFLL